MRVSIVTVSFNSSEYISDALVSIFSQTYPDIEFLLIDGCSNDKTVDIAKKLAADYNIRSIIQSAPDRGIYDAMNKGIALATGEVIGFLNSDDMFSDDNVIQDIVNAFKSSNQDIVYGDLKYVDRIDPGRIKRYWRSGEKPKSGMRYGWHPPHPAFYVKRQLLIQEGGFNHDLRISADYDQMIRLIEKLGTQPVYIPRVFVHMRTGGESNRSLRNILKANIECVQSWKNNGIQSSPFLIPGKLLMKMAQRNAK